MEPATRAAAHALTDADAIGWLASHSLSDLDRLCGPMGMLTAGAFPVGNRYLAAAKLTKCLVAAAGDGDPASGHSDENGNNNDNGEDHDSLKAMRRAAASALKAFGMDDALAGLLMHCDFVHAYPLVLAHVEGRRVDWQAIDPALHDATGGAG